MLPSIIKDLKQIEPNIYRLSPLKSTNMLVEADIISNEKLLHSIEEQTWQQIINACSLEGVNKVVITPDVHVGYGVPIGCVIASKTHLYPAAAGYDISCGMCLIKTSANIEDFVSYETRHNFIQEVEKRVPTGIGTHRAPLQRKLNKDELYNILYYGANAIEDKNRILLGYHERTHLPVEKHIQIPPKAQEKISECGSLGGGNHFCELQVNKSGQIYVMIHTGSRGFGWNIADYFFKKGKHLCKNSPIAGFRFDSQIGQEYWALHNMAANFAIANRIIIIDAIIDALKEIKPDIKITFVYEISHNLIQQEFNYFVHRKGATRAWNDEIMPSHKAHPILIPGSMTTGAAVLVGLSNTKKSLYSINHGAGRILGRKQSKKLLNQKKANEYMNNIVQSFNGYSVKGIVLNTKNVPLDEFKDCYKDLDLVLDVVQNAQLAKVVERLYPIAVIKGED